MMGGTTEPKCNRPEQTSPSRKCGREPVEEAERLEFAAQFACLLRRQTPHSPTPVRVLAVLGAAGAKPISCWLKARDIGKRQMRSAKEEFRGWVKHRFVA